jgi:uncharacterized protein Yka (UPF0111/DUF47 family)
MTKAELTSLTLAETLFARAFAQNTEADLQKLIARCIEAAIAYDEAINKLDKPKAKAKAA